MIGLTILVIYLVVKWLWTLASYRLFVGLVQGWRDMDPQDRFDALTSIRALIPEFPVERRPMN